MHHKNLVSLVGYCSEKAHLALVYEYMPRGNLFDHLRGLYTAKFSLIESLGLRINVLSDFKIYITISMCCSDLRNHLDLFEQMPISE